jgi:hypothetical protein
MAPVIHVRVEACYLVKVVEHYAHQVDALGVELRPECAPEDGDGGRYVKSAAIEEDESTEGMFRR